MDLAFITSNVVALAHRYGQLRERLFSDLHHVGPEPPWRTVGVEHVPNFVVRGMPGYPPHHLASYALRSAGTDSENVQLWDFTVVPADGSTTSSTHRIRVVRDGKHENAELPDELHADPAARLQLQYGMRVLSSRPL
jgi:hypothetical protein